MIKVIWAADRKPGLSDQEFYGWWHDSHGLKEFGCTSVRRYVQHHTLAETRGGAYGATPTRDGASMGWYDDLDQMRDSYATTDASGWTATNFQPDMDVVIASEHVVLDGPTTPGMVKIMGIARRNPRLSVEEFQRRWLEEHGPRWAKVPGMRRYVQNHGLAEAYGAGYNPRRPDRRMTHDGWSEDWFDDLESLKRALASPEAKAAREHSADLFDRPISLVIARESVIVG
jgi:uncharacterized protein (TIGR02118 family)